MAKTVNSAFVEFNKNIVNLDSTKTTKAISSRDWLWNQLNNLQNKDKDFPLKYNLKHRKFGSFARKTKIRELDDIDMMFCLTADNAFYNYDKSTDTYYIKTPNAGSRLQNLSDDGVLNSRKVVNIFVSALSDIEHYKKADIHRRQEAATLQLTSYEWNFDIVPCFYTSNGFFLIPDGNGNWKATNPDIDQNRVTNTNQKHNGKILQIIRTLKFWNRHAKIPTMSSYLLENFILNYFSKDQIYDDLSINLNNFWCDFASSVYTPVQDPKGFQGNLNTLSKEDKDKISQKASDACGISYKAYQLEFEESDYKGAINKWREIFGSQFPNFG